MHSLTTLICCDLHFPNETATYASEAKKPQGLLFHKIQTYFYILYRYLLSS